MLLLVSLLASCSDGTDRSGDPDASLDVSGDTAGDSTDTGIDGAGDSTDGTPDSDDSEDGSVDASDTNDDSSDVSDIEDALELDDATDIDDDAVDVSDATDIEDIDDDAVDVSDVGDATDSTDDAGDASDTTDAEVIEPPECETGTIDCDGTDQRECVDGNYVVLDSCAFECVEIGEDMVACGCQSNADCELAEFCDENGLCQQDVCTPAVNGCADGTVTRCEDDGSGEVTFDCGDLVCGTGPVCICTDDDQCGSDQFCNESKGQCVPNVCTPGAQFCAGSLIQECTGSGDGVNTVKVCASGCEVIGGAPVCVCDDNGNCSSSEYCDGQSCVPDKCTPFTERCSLANEVETCRGDGSGFDSTPCGSATCQEGVCVCTDDDQCAGTDLCLDGSCVTAACDAGETYCVNDSLFECNDRGSTSSFVETCAEDCVDGACTCSTSDDCSPGSTCDGGSCICASGTICGNENICCAAGDICLTGEFCDSSGCFDTSVCAPPCASGERCGARGGLCCDGATPVCGDDNICAPDCGGNALCGPTGSRVCCGSDELCIFNSCEEPGTGCDDFADCDYDEYCEETIGQCLPNEFPDDLICQLEYDFAEFEPTITWHWTGVEVDGKNFVNVIGSPVAGNVDQSIDGVAEVVVVAYDTNYSNEDEALVVISGADGTTRYYNREKSLRSNANVSLANVDDDPYLEMALNMKKGIGMVDDIVNCPDPRADSNGCYLWTYTAGTMNRSLDGGTTAFADFNQDGVPEVYSGSVVLDARTGALIADGGTASTADGKLGNQFIAAAEDVDGDGMLELLTGDCAWDVDFDNNQLVEVWCNDTFANGVPGVADIVDNGTGTTIPEVVVVNNNDLYILRGDTGEQLFKGDQPGNGYGGAPNIADFDNDGRPEIGVANSGCYTVYDIDCIGDTDADLPGCTRPTFPACTPGVDCVVEPCPDVDGGDGSGLGILWSIKTKDTSSSSTGSSVFDFQGDGVAEVLYNDECRFLALDGRSGIPLLSYSNTSRTGGEYPIVVDVNGDDRSEVVIIANNDQYNRDCVDLIPARPDYFPECAGAFDSGANQEDFPEFCYKGSQGVFAFGDPEDRWVRTRTIWNQHAYSITNIEEDGTVPSNPAPNYTVFNNYRANRQGGVPLNSPDATIVQLVPNALQCPPELEVIATIGNDGTRGIPAGLPVRFFYDVGAGSVPFETVLTQEPLFPGGTTVVRATYIVERTLFETPIDYTVDVNIDENGDPVFPDCNPGENSKTLEDIVCFDSDVGIE